MRAADRREVACLGIPALSALFRSYRRGVMRRTALVDGEVAAMWGVGGAMFGSVGTPWLLTGSAAERVSPLRFVRVYQAEVAAMLSMFPVLRNVVDAEYAASVRLLRLIGFSLSEPVPFGPQGALFRVFEMRAM